jgi:hypothetical protein
MLAEVGLSVICVQKVPLRKAREINALHQTSSANQLKYPQIQLFADSPAFCPSNERLTDKSVFVRQPGVRR